MPFRGAGVQGAEEYYFLRDSSPVFTPDLSLARVLFGFSLPIVFFSANVSMGMAV
jgi:hypothetical protein